MSAKPATTPVWDSNGTNLATPSGGQVTDGAAVNAILASGIFNYLLMWITRWIVYLADGIIQHPIKTRVYAAAAGNARVALNVGDTYGFIQNIDDTASGIGSWSPESGTADQWFQWNLTFDVGERIRAIRFKGKGHATETLRMKIFKVEIGVAVSQIGTTQTTATTATEQTLTVTGLTETISATYHYVVEIRATGGGVSAHRLEVDYDRVTS